MDKTNSYFITVITQNRVCFFADVKKGSIELYPSGKMVMKWWLKLPNKFPGLILDRVIIMPNHLHGLLHLKRNDHSISDIMWWLKTMTTNEYIRNVNNANWESFDGRLW